ncbi:MAG: signal peptidase I [Beggiatoa sp. IS2]|nr:MAG: signal peptidase I [Beggiatoa sp. IS2]
MNFDLATILTFLMLLTGLIWLYDTVRLAPRRAMAKANLSDNASEVDRKKANHIPLVVDLSRSLFPVFLIVLMLRSFLVEPFRIPSGSMMPTLLVGDFILVNKFTYGIRLPVINTKIIGIGKPKRGDVIVFRYPEKPSIPFIKRVVGLPGDHISYNEQNKTLYVNNEAVAQKPMGAYQGIGKGSDMTGREARLEYLPNAEHQIIVDTEDLLPTESTSEIDIPAGQYFVLGDNRDNSRDSRYWGTVPEQNLIGKAFFIWMSWDGGVNWQRVGTAIK